MIGLTLAYSVLDYEPLPVTQAMVRKEKRAEHICLMLVAAMAVVMAAFVVNGFLWSVLIQLFGETVSNSQGSASFFPSNAWRSFFLMLAGAGIFEETLFRLVCVSLFWRLTHRPWAATILPLCCLAPIIFRRSTQPSSVLGTPITIFTQHSNGVVMGYMYHKHGYETVVLGHTQQLGAFAAFSCGNNLACNGDTDVKEI
jgi:membrane protease YdiL (CAAX protease family)